MASLAAADSFFTDTDWADAFIDTKNVFRTGQLADFERATDHEIANEAAKYAMIRAILTLTKKRAGWWTRELGPKTIQQERALLKDRVHTLRQLRDSNWTNAQTEELLQAIQQEAYDTLHPLEARDRREAVEAFLESEQQELSSKYEKKMEQTMAKLRKQRKRQIAERSRKAKKWKKRT
jgi:hypothetical protein